jgi:hypothetical protein
LNIYAFILRNFYPDEIVFSLSGRVCSPAKNPFNEDKPTLMIKIVNGCAMHTDTENAIAPGDAFDFAARYFEQEGTELYAKLDDYLNLGLSKSNRLLPPALLNPVAPKPLQIIIKSPVFSYFMKPVANTTPARQITLPEVYQLIKGGEFMECTKTLRAIPDAKEARKYKARNFNYVTFSGIFSQRNDANLIKHSGLLTIDFDHIENIPDLRHALLNDPYFETELLFTSPSGDGLKWIIPIDLVQVKHADYFMAVSNYILKTYNLTVDQSGKDVSRACFLPHDPDVFIHSKYL